MAARIASIVLLRFPFALRWLPQAAADGHLADPSIRPWRSRQRGPVDRQQRYEQI